MGVWKRYCWWEGFESFALLRRSWVGEIRLLDT
jgi:hypothetical protein